MNNQKKSYWRRLLPALLSVLLSPVGIILLFLLYQRFPNLLVKNVLVSQVLRDRGGSCIDVVSFSPDGSKILAGDKNETLYWLDATNGQVIRQFKFDHPMNSLKFTGLAGPVILNSRYDGVYSIDPGRGEVSRKFKMKPGFVSDGVISKDGQYLVTHNASDPPRLWDLMTDKMVMNLGTQIADGAAIAPDSKRALTCHENGDLNLWDLASGKCVRTMPSPLEDYKSAYMVSFLPDGKRAVVVYVGEIGVWNLESGALEKIFRKRSSFDGAPWGSNAIRISPDGKKLFLEFSKQVVMYDLATGKKMAAFGNAGDPWFASVQCIDLSPDGRRLIAGCRDGKIRVFEIP